MKSPYLALILDLIAVAVFALLARLAHQSDDMPLNFGGWLSTVWPFWIGVAISWVLILARKWDGFLLRPAGLAAWVITVLTGLVIWTIRNGAVPHWSFILVATTFSGVLMLGWRGLAKLGRK